MEMTNEHPYIEHLERASAELVARINASPMMPKDLIRHHSEIGSELIRAREVVEHGIITPSHQYTVRQLMRYDTTTAPTPDGHQTVSQDDSKDVGQ